MPTQTFGIAGGTDDHHAFSAGNPTYTSQGEGGER